MAGNRDTTNSGSSSITGAGISTAIAPSSVGVNPTSRGELILNGALGNAAMGGMSGPNMIGSSGAGYNAPSFGGSGGGGIPTQRDRIHAYMGGSLFDDNEDEDEMIKKFKQMMEMMQGKLGSMQPQALIQFPNQQNMFGSVQSPNLFNQSGVLNMNKTL